MNHIKELRKKHGYSQQALAKILYVNQTAVSQWERGVTTPSAPILLRLCELFSTSTDYLLGREPLDTKKDSPPSKEDEPSVEDPLDAQLKDALRHASAERKRAVIELLGLGSKDE